MLTSGLFALLLGEEGSEAVQPLATADEQIVGGQRIGEFLQPLGDSRQRRKALVVC